MRYTIQQYSNLIGSLIPHCPPHLKWQAVIKLLAARRFCATLPRNIQREALVVKTKAVLDEARLKALIFDFITG